MALAYFIVVLTREHSEVKISQQKPYQADFKDQKGKRRAARVVSGEAGLQCRDSKEQERWSSGAGLALSRCSVSSRQAFQPFLPRVLPRGCTLPKSRHGVGQGGCVQQNTMLPISWGPRPCVQGRSAQHRTVCTRVEDTGIGKDVKIKKTQVTASYPMMPILYGREREFKIIILTWISNWMVKMSRRLVKIYQNVLGILHFSLCKLWPNKNNTFFSPHAVLMQNREQVCVNLEVPSSCRSLFYSCCDK